MTVESLQLAAATARAISESDGNMRSVAVAPTARPARDLYPVATAPTDVPVARKVDLLGAIDAHARSLDPRVKQVMASLVSQQRHVLMNIC